MASVREIVGKRVAKLFEHGDVVNLGIGMPTAVADYLPPEANIVLHSENGFTGLGSTPAEGQEDKDLTNAGGKPVTILPGGACFDSALSFAVIRGGHLAATVLGALEVDEKGNLANWMIPGKMVPGMGGAMDLVTGARQVIIAMEHTTRDGRPKILKECSLPLTAVGVVDVIVTEMGLMRVGAEGIMLEELAPGVSVDDVQAKTEASLIVSPNLTTMNL